MPVQLDTVLSAAQVRQTAASILAAQEPSGAIAWYPGGHTDPWDHVEAAMGLDVAGHHAAAERAYDWLRRTQRPDGSWPSRIERGRVTNADPEVHFTSYVAVGVWHHTLATGDERFVRRLWPAVRRALDWVLELQRPSGEFAWSRGLDGQLWHEALVTSNASVYQSLRAGLAVAQHLGEEQPDWELAAGLLGHALRHHLDERFAGRDRWSMDWYYPVLGGAIVGADAGNRFAHGWGRFVIEGHGVRCVSDRPWVTGGESCELALALAGAGERDHAAQIVADIQHLRHDDGSYWTGREIVLDRFWPVERTTWTSAAVLLALDAAVGGTPTATIFHPGALPLGVDPDDVTCGDEAAPCGLTLEPPAAPSSVLADAAEHP